MSSPEFTSNRDNYCYRHPDRQSFVLCQRCMRTICPACQTPAAVGVICPECMKEQQKNRTPAQRKADRRWGARSVAAVAGGRPVMTYAIMAITAFVGLLQLIPGVGVTEWLGFHAAYLYPDLSGQAFQPWRLVTAMLVHGGIFHLILNMLPLWLIGQNLEPMLGKWRFLAMYLLGGIGGNVAVALISPEIFTVGASGAIFAMFGMLLVIGLHLGQNMIGLIVILGINLVIGFIPGFNIAWQAHVGGMATGALLGLIFVRTRSRRALQTVLLAAVVLLLIVVIVVVVPARIALLG